MNRWVDRWNAYWYPETTTVPLSISRIIMVATQLVWFFPSLDKHLGLVEKHSDFINPQVIISAIAAVFPRQEYFTASNITALYWITIVAGIAALVGLFTRTSVFIFALGVWIFITHEYSYDDRHHTEAIFCIFLMLLAFSPSGERFALDALIRRRRGHAVPATTDLAMWPIKLAHVLLAMTYFSTGMSKLVAGWLAGISWMNGYTLQLYTFNDALNRNIPLGVWLSQQHGLAIALSVFTILFEVFFFLSLVFPWTAPFFFVVGIFFHLGLYFTGGHDFFQHMVLLFILLLFIAPPWWQAWMDRIAGAIGLPGRARVAQPQM
ncbi:MAG: HTTM domain-containing protein [Gemmatimonadales bacterium]